MWDESAATLSPPPGLDIARYRAALMTRFANPALQHRTRQIAMDGSQKMPQRLVAPLLQRRAEGRSVEAITLAIAAWMRWQGGVDDTGKPFPVDDPLADRTRAALAGCATPADRVAALLGIEAIFPPALAADHTLVEALAGHLDRLERAGSLAALG